MIAPLLGAIVPLVILIALGYGLKRRLITQDDVWKGIESLAYFVLMPCLLFSNIARADLSGLPWGALVTPIYLTMLTLGALALVPMLWRKNLSGPTRSSQFQGMVRFNLYVSLAMGLALFNPQQLAILGLLAGATVVLANLLCVTALLYLNSGQVRPSSLARELIKNPLLMACVVAGLFNLSGFGLPEFGWATVERLGQTALPLSLLAIGAGLSFKNLNAHWGLNIYVGSLQLLVKPALAASLSLALGAPPELAVVVLLLLATPTAPSSYILARKLGGDAPVMASILAFQTLAGFGTLLVVLTLWQVITGVRLA